MFAYAIVDTSDSFRSRTNSREILESSYAQRHWLPLAGSSPDFDDVPQHIAEAASEAHQCMSIGAYRGAVQLARSVVEATAKEQGHTRGNLRDKIDALRAADSIREHIKEAAHEIRYLGNAMAHGDFVSPVTEVEAEETLTLMGEVLNEVFQSPALVQKRKAARVAAKGSN